MIRDNNNNIEKWKNHCQIEEKIHQYINEISEWQTAKTWKKLKKTKKKIQHKRKHQINTIKIIA